MIQAEGRNAYKANLPALNVFLCKNLPPHPRALDTTSTWVIFHLSLPLGMSLSQNDLPPPPPPVVANQLPPYDSPFKVNKSYNSSEPASSENPRYLPAFPKVTDIDRIVIYFNHFGLNRPAIMHVADMKLSTPCSAQAQEVIIAQAKAWFEYQGGWDFKSEKNIGQYIGHNLMPLGDLNKLDAVIELTEEEVELIKSETGVSFKPACAHSI